MGWLWRRVFACSSFVATQQEVELEDLVRWVCLCVNVGWLVWRLVGDNASALAQVASLRAGAGLQRQNCHPRHLRRLFYLMQRLEAIVCLEFVPEDLNLANCLSRVGSEWQGRVPLACEGAQVRRKALDSFEDVPSLVWV